MSTIEVFWAVGTAANVIAVLVFFALAIDAKSERERRRFLRLGFLSLVLVTVLAILKVR